MLWPQLSQDIQQMRIAIVSRVNIDNGLELGGHLLLQIEQLKSLQNHPDAAVSALKGANNPGVIGAGRFSRNVEARVRVRADEVRVQRAELARPEESVRAGGAVVHGPVEALASCQLSRVVFIHKSQGLTWWVM